MHARPYVAETKGRQAEEMATRQSCFFPCRSFLVVPWGRCVATPRDLAPSRGASCRERARTACRARYVNVRITAHYSP